MGGGRFDAACFLATAPSSRPCAVELAPRGLVIAVAGGPDVLWPYERLACRPTGDEETWLLLTCPDAADGRVSGVAVRDPGLVAALADRTRGECHDVAAGFGSRRRRAAGRLWRSLLLFALALALGAAATWFLLVRYLPGVVAAALPIETEAALGKALAAQVLADEEPIRAGPAADAVQAIAARLVAAVEHDPGYPFEVHLVKSPLVNAMALPGGQIVVHSALLEEAESPAEVAGVIAHEIQHVLHRDSVTRLVGRLGGWAVIALATGGGDLAAVATQADALLQLSYDRDQELAADRDGLALLQRAGFSAAALPRFFERLERRGGAGMPEMLSTHPDTARRIGELRRLAADLPPLEERPIDIDWAAVRASLD